MGLFKKITRDQWREDTPSSVDNYEQQMAWTWEETRTYMPDYFARLRFAVEKARGTVLEMGCGIGTMTRWLAESDAVERIVAVDAFPGAIEKLREYNLPKTECVQAPCDALELPEGVRFDTVLCCELIEHLYPREERKMLKVIRRHLADGAAYVVSTPIGFMPDPHHVRGFELEAFKKHLARHYGPAREIDYQSGYSQSGYGVFEQ